MSEKKIVMRNFNGTDWDILYPKTTADLVETSGSMQFITAAEKTKLAGIATGANKYSLPIASPSVLGGVKTGTNIVNASGTISVADGTTSTKGVVQLTDGVTSTSTTTAATPNSVKTAYDLAASKASTSVASTSANGLMTAADKIKLNGIAANANNYVHPETHPASMITGLSAVATGGRYSDLTGRPTLGTVASKDTGTTSGTIPIIGSDNKLDASILPSIAISDTHVVNSQTAMLALNVQVGDIAVRTDLSKSFILKTAGATTLANWQELLTPVSPVQSVAGKTGAVTLAKGDVGLGNLDNIQQATKTEFNTHNTDSVRHITAAERTAWNAKASTAVATTSANGLMAATDKTKLDGIAAGAQVNTITSVAGKTGAVTLVKGDVGLGSVTNYGIATKVEAQEGTATNKYVTPQRVRDFIEAEPDFINGFKTNSEVTPYSRVVYKDVAVSTSAPHKLLDPITGAALDKSVTYVINAYIAGTATVTGLIAIIEGNGTAFTISQVYSTGTGSNHPKVYLDGGEVYISTDHTSTYKLVFRLERFNNQARPNLAYAVQDMKKVVTTSANGLMSSSDKTKLDGIAAGAQVNTITSVAGKTGDVTLAKGDVGLGSVQNYSIASQAEAEAGTATNRYVTPQRVDQQLKKTLLANFVGGENLINFSQFPEKWDYTIDGNVKNRVGGISASQLFDITVPAGNYVYSFKVNKKPEQSTSFTVYLNSEATTFTTSSNFHQFTAGVTYTRIFNFTEPTRVGVTCWGNSKGEFFEFSMKFEKGLVATDYSLSAADIIYLHAKDVDYHITSAERTKLAGIAANANNYSLPAATSSTRGGVITGTNIVNSSGTISVADGTTSAKGVVQLSDATNSTSTTVAATANAVKKAYDLANGKAGTSVATTTANGLMASADKTKLDGIAAGANNYTLPAATASALGGVKTGTNITNSSGTISVPYASATVSGVVKVINTLTGTATADALSAAQGKALNDALAAHTGNKSNPHGVTKAQVGLGNVDNTSDANKPVSTATQTALNKKANTANPVFTGDITIGGAKLQWNSTEGSLDFIFN